MTILIIVACSIVHSIFGVGLLVFGTPIFLLLGHSYSETLWIVLPPSIAINALQIWENKSLIAKPRSYLLWFIIPTAVFAYIALNYFSEINIRKAVGSMLVLSALLRFVPRTQILLKNYIQQHQKVFVGLIGSVHGLTNMGGGLLTVMMGTLYNSKDAFRVNVAFGYLVMALIKIITVVILGVQLQRPGDLPLHIVVAVFTYFVIGNALYRRVSNFSMQHALTVLIFSFGILLLI